MTRIIQHLRLKPEDRFRVLSNMARELSFSRFSRQAGLMLSIRIRSPYVQLLSIIQKIGILNSRVDSKATEH